MSTKLIELRPDRNLLNPDFNGYKLSLEKIPVLTEELETSIDRVKPNSEQYSLLHAKLFGLHNYLINDTYNEKSNVYFIDGNWNVKRIIINETTGRISEVRKVWTIPKNEYVDGRYNPTLCFTKEYAILSDGCGLLYIVETGERNENENWNSVFSDVILENKVFTVNDAVFLTTNNVKEIHCLLNYVEKSDEKFLTVINWVTVHQTSDQNWGANSLKVLKGGGQLYYCSLERNCKYIYIASDSQFKFLLDSENPIKETELKNENLKVYTWLQSSDDITLRFNVSNDNKNNVYVKPMPFHIEIRFNDIVLLHGELRNRIDSDLTTWTINNNILEITVTKTESGLMWDEFVKDDKTGEQILDASIVEEVHQRLAHLCSKTEVIPGETGPTYSSQQIEECDFTGDDTAIFERICGSTHHVTHRVNLGSFQLITSVKLIPDQPSALALRHDVDACLWQPVVDNGEWNMKHEGTLLAFGYVQVMSLI